MRIKKILLNEWTIYLKAFPFLSLVIFVLMIIFVFHCFERLFLIFFRILLDTSSKRAFTQGNDFINTQLSVSLVLSSNSFKFVKQKVQIGCLLNKAVPLLVPYLSSESGPYFREPIVWPFSAFIFKREPAVSSNLKQTFKTFKQLLNYNLSCKNELIFRFLFKITHTSYKLSNKEIFQNIFVLLFWIFYLNKNLKTKS